MFAINVGVKETNRECFDFAFVGQRLEVATQCLGVEWPNNIALGTHAFIRLDR